MKYEYIEIKKLLFQERNQTFHRTVFMLTLMFKRAIKHETFYLREKVSSFLFYN